MSDKTPAQLVQAVDLLPGDLLTSYRQSTSGPMKSLLYDTLLSTLTTFFSSTFLKTANYLSEISAAGAAALSQARLNLGLGGAAVLNVGQAANTVSAGDDSRFSANAAAAANAAATANAAMPKAGGDFSARPTITSQPTMSVVVSGATYTGASGRMTVSTAAAPSTLAPGELWVQTS